MYSNTAVCGSPHTAVAASHSKHDITTTAFITQWHYNHEQQQHSCYSCSMSSSLAAAVLVLTLAALITETSLALLAVTPSNTSRTILD
jgi:hypothetical protein